MGTLYLVATPIGNLEDISYRAIRILQEVDYIAAEDTRHTLKLLNHFEITTHLESYHEHNRYEKGEKIARDLEQGKNVALVTDAGTPAISDPGEDLVRLCNERGLAVTSVPGAAAFVTGLILSGKDTKRFIFDGFLPMDKKERAKRIEELSGEFRTTILYEAPHKLKRTLKDLSDALGGGRQISIARELTKKFEEVLNVTLEEAVQYYADNDPRGEYVLVIEGGDREAAEKREMEAMLSMSLEEHLEKCLSEGLNKKDAIKQVAKERRLPKREVYNHFNRD